MIGRSHLRVLLPQFNGQLRVTFQYKTPAFLRQVQECKHLPGHFEYKGRIIEWKPFSGSRPGQAVVVNLFDVQVKILIPVVFKHR
jgi:hypothetical protein